jgi:hypothetical protein
MAGTSSRTGEILPAPSMLPHNDDGRVVSAPVRNFEVSDDAAQDSTAA